MAISEGALTQYEADVGGRARNVCACAIVGVPRCVAGTCQISAIANGG